MNKLELKLFNCDVDNFNIYVNDELVKFTRDKYGNYVYNYTGENNLVNVSIETKPSELDTKFWFPLYLFYYLVSLFGIFDNRYSKNYYSADYKFQIDTTSVDSLELIFNKPDVNVPVVREKNNKLPANETNKYVYRKDLKFRRKFTSIFKYVSWIVIIVLIVLLTIEGGK